MSTFHLPALLSAICLSLVACSADAGNAPQTRGATKTPAAPMSGTSSAGSAAQTAANPSGPGLVVPTAPNTPPQQAPSTDPMAMEPSLDPVSIDQTGPDNPAGLTPDEAQTLIAGGDPGDMRFLYPYEGTVFPRGMLAPLLMWQQSGDMQPDVVYVHIKAQRFEYKSILKTEVDQPGPMLVIPQDVWLKAGLQTKGRDDPFTLELTARTNGRAMGPVTLHFNIAQATIKGSIYYNSYVSPASLTGSIFRIPAGGNFELFLGGLGGGLPGGGLPGGGLPGGGLPGGGLPGAACYGCHTVSANGERMISHVGGDPGSSYALTPMTQPNPPQLAAAPLPGFAGLAPDGKVYVASAHPPGPVRPQGTPMEAALVNDANLYDTDTGAIIPGTGVAGGAMMPTFDPAGALLTFTDFGVAEGRGLAVMSFDPVARQFSGHRVVYTDTDRYPGWPFFLPDSKAVVFARGVNPGFSGAGAGVIPGTGIVGPESDLYMVDLATGTATILARAMGMNSAMDPTPYVPFGADDLHKHYYPTISPVPAGGYFWLFFDSIRNYGSLGLQRQLWGSAIEIRADGDYSVDRSHPAFFLPGQEYGTGNHRAFAALDPCKKDGDTCKSAVDCCGGTCNFPPPMENIEPVGSCSPPMMNMCAKQDEKCTTDRDCCLPFPGEPPLSCIAGRCAMISLD
jgi:hypothetical protein